MLAVYLNLLEVADRKERARELAEELRRAGFFPPPRYKFNGDLRGVVSYLYRRWFDRPQPGQSRTIENDQSAGSPPAATGSDPPADPAPEARPS